MAKFGGSKASGRRVGRGPVATAPRPTTRTREGGAGFRREDAKSELFLLAVTNMVSEDTFYETGDQRDERFINLVHEVTQQDSDWVRRFIPWLRKEANMRSASIQAVAEYVAAGGVGGRALVPAVLTRADEPGELVAYFRNQGLTIPKPIKRGISEAIGSLYTQGALDKYDGQDRAWNFGDVIEMVHPTPADDVQAAWFKYLVDRAHNPAAPVPATFKRAAARRRINTDDDASAEDAAKAGLDWTSASAKGAMDAAAWEAQIPKMGYMALLRNLRNFSQAGISPASVAIVNRRLADPEEVARSRQFPYRFISAYMELDGLTYASALDAAINLSLSNVPKLDGSTLVMLDCSSSMQSTVAGNSKMNSVLVGLTFAAGFQRQNPGTRVFGYGREPYLELTTEQRDSSILVMARDLQGMLRGEATHLWSSLDKVWSGEERIVVVTDEQSHDSPTNFGGFDKTRIFIWNVGGYSTGTAGGQNVTTLGGFTDKMWTLVDMIDRGKRGDWPF